jgi:hypothetical protein
VEFQFFSQRSRNEKKEIRSEISPIRSEKQVIRNEFAANPLPLSAADALICPVHIARR